jgi:hypothetical protein
LRQLQACVLLQALDVDQGTHKLGVQQSLIGQSLDVLGGVRVNMLQRAGKLVIESLDERDNAAGNAEDLARTDRGQLLVVLPFLGVLNDNNLRGVLENLEKLAKLLVRTGTCQYCNTRVVSWATYSFHCSWFMWLAVPDVKSKRVEMRVSRTRIRW